MLTREFVLEQIKQMPERFTIDEIMEKLFFLYKIEIALEQSKADQVIPHEQIKEKYRKWLQ